MSGWEGIVGHDKAKNFFINTTLLDDVFNSYMISGNKGSGKESCADLFAMSLLCERSDKPCMVCNSCVKAVNKCHPDIIHVLHEKPGSISVEEIRKQLIGPMAVKPYYKKRKIFIIKDAQLMTVQAQNALLKTLEESPVYGVIILITTTEEKILDTIRSRVVNIHLTEVNKELIKKYLIDKYKMDAMEAEVCAGFAQGSIGQAMDMVENEEYRSMRKLAIDIVCNITSLQVADLSSYIKSISEYKEAIDTFLGFLSTWYHDILVYKTTGSMKNCLFKDELNRISAMSITTSYEGLSDIIGTITKSGEKLKANVAFEPVIELLLLKMKEINNEDCSRS